MAVHLRQDSADIVALHLAILKAGATQVFIDPDSPSHLYQQILADAAPTVLITETQLAAFTDAPLGVTGMTIRLLNHSKWPIAALSRLRIAHSQAEVVVSHQRWSGFSLPANRRPLLYQRHHWHTEGG